MLPGILYFFTSSNKILTQIGLSILLPFLFLSFKNGKPYYFYPILTTLFPIGSFCTSAPNTGDLPKTTIALSYKAANVFKDFFAEVTLVQSIYNPYPDTEDKLYQRIYICQKPIQNYNELKKKLEQRIFE